MQSPVTNFLFDLHANRRGTANRWGTAPLDLVHFLTTVHNRMFFDDPNRQVIPLTAVHQSNVVSVGSVDEILTLVESHNEYEVGGETKAEYNWPAIEREVLHKYISNKPKISFSKDQLPCYVYQEDFNLHNQMQALSDTQTFLTRELQASIVTLLPPRIGKLKEILKELEVLINFLSVMSHIEEDNSLADYMEATFGREPGYVSKDIKLKHVRHVWLIVKYTQTDLLMRQFQEPFGDIDPQYTDVLDNHLEEMLKECCTFNSPKTRLLLEELFRYIVLRLNKAAIEHGSESTNTRLQDILQYFILDTANEDDERASKILEELPTLPDQLLIKHASRAWCFIWTRFTTPTG